MNLSYEIDTFKPNKEPEKLKILEGVSGQANSGEMLALVSGMSGKRRG